jgi:hypothetical protein
MLDLKKYILYITIQAPNQEIRVADPYSFFPDPDPASEDGHQSGSRAYVQVIEEAFSSQKRPSNTSKHELLQIFVYFCFVGHFCPPGSRSTDLIKSGSRSATLQEIAVIPFSALNAEKD